MEHQASYHCCPMKIAAGAVVTIAYDICTEDGEIVESSELNGPVSFVQGKGAMIPGLDAKLIGMEVAELVEDDVAVRMIHPLAGKTVTMNVAVHKVRDATAAERESGKVVRTPPPPPKNG